MHEDNPFSYCDNYFTTPGSRNETRARPFFALSALAFIAAAGFSAWRLLPDENDGVMSCSTKAIMRFENMEKENVNGNIHLILPPTAKVDGRRRLYRFRRRLALSAALRQI
jgi:hypothetical protein